MTYDTLHNEGYLPHFESSEAFFDTICSHNELLIKDYTTLTTPPNLFEGIYVAVEDILSRRAGFRYTDYIVYVSSRGFRELQRLGEFSEINGMIIVASEWVKDYDVVVMNYNVKKGDRLMIGFGDYDEKRIPQSQIEEFEDVEDDIVEIKCPDNREDCCLDDPHVHERNESITLNLEVSL